MKILITGGNGTLGQSLMRYFPEHEYAIICRNELHLKETVQEYGCVAFLGSIEDYSFLITTFRNFLPDVVIHAAAIKHLDIAEKYPMSVMKTNITGSINVIEATQQIGIPVFIGVSTDKACSPRNTYGYSKSILEKCISSAKSNNSKFLSVRFANIAGSSGSVIQIWNKQKSLGKPLTVTDSAMVRLMFSQLDAATFLMDVLKTEREYPNGATICKLTPFVNIQELALLLSENINITGAVTGEKLYEDLISENELPYTKILPNNTVLITVSKNPAIDTRLKNPYNANTAPKMSILQMKELIKEK